MKQHQGGGQKFSKKTWCLARLPPKLGPDDLGTLMGESGVQFRVGLHPPEVGRPSFEHYLAKKKSNIRCLVCLLLELDPGGLGTLDWRFGRKIPRRTAPPRGRATLILQFLFQNTDLGQMLALVGVASSVA